MILVHCLLFHNVTVCQAVFGDWVYRMLLTDPYVEILAIACYQKPILCDLKVELLSIRLNDIIENRIEFHKTIHYPESILIALWIWMLLILWILMSRDIRRDDFFVHFDNGNNLALFNFKMSCHNNWFIFGPNGSKSTGDIRLIGLMNIALTFVNISQCFYSPRLYACPCLLTLCHIIVVEIWFPIYPTFFYTYLMKF